MDIQLILGPNGSGKSLYAENLAVQSGKPLIYLATMIPQNQENYQRIEKHRLQRKGKGFTTIETPWNIHEIPIEKEAVVLLEDASNLMGTGIFVHGTDESEVLRQILSLAEKCRKLIIVSISGLDENQYDGETASFIHQLNTLNSDLASLASFVHQMSEQSV